MSLVELLHLIVLKCCGVRQHNCSRVCCGWGGVDWPLDAVRLQLRREATVVDVRMAKDDSVYLLRRKRKGLVIELFLSLGSLEKAAIEKNLSVTSLKPEA